MDKRRKQKEGTEEKFRRLSKELEERVIQRTAELLRSNQALREELAERKRLESQLLHLATHDPLTDLFNRQYLQEALERQLAQSRRYGTVGALLILDVDQFQDINKSLGHFAGDEVLGSLAGMLRKQVRESDLVARPGGDRFAILLQHTDEHQTAIVARHLLEAVQSHTVVNIARQFGVTATIGIVLVPKHGATSGELLARAEIALSQAREGGCNSFSVYTPDRDGEARIAARLNWKGRLRQALEKGLFFLEAQPVLHLRSNRIAQYELLLRLVGDGGRVVLPGTFLDIAEQFGLIHDIDRWVVRHAIRLIAQQRRAGRELILEVNLSAKAFADRQLLPMIEAELGTASISPGSLVLEVTETAAITNIHQAQKFVHSLKSLGCQFALDDFGAGFASFYHLKHLPVDYVKLDGSFIRNLAHDSLDQHLVKAMVEVARGLGKETIAESVEDEATVDLLRKYGVGYAQGYHIGKPSALA
jgi:diguanylate cyclase (GGDEF)-like protein